MRSVCLIAAILFLAGFRAAAALSTEMDQSYTCTLCHSDKKNEFASDIHYRQNILCETCHGGDASTMDESSHSKTVGFKGILRDKKPPFSKKEIVRLCSSCHSDARKMLQYAIPSDQEALFRISQHGIALYRKNDENVAVCTDCHGIHQILPPSDPRSTVYFRNLPATCAVCHSDEKLMRQYHLPWDTYEKFTKSIHGVALFENNDMRSPNCSFCHGVHGATPPRVSEIENVCGNCHNRTREFFNLSPHRRAMEAQGMQECVSCHGSHDIKKSSLSLFDTVCTECHDPSSGAYRRGQSIKALVIEAAGTIEDAKAEAREAISSGIDIAKYKQDLEEAETNLIRTAPETHSLSIAAIEKLARASMALADDVKLELFHHHEGLQERKLILIVVWGFIALMIPVTLAKRYRITQKLRDRK